MVEEIKRQTAYKCTIATLNKGTFIKKEGWESSYLMTEYGDFSRVNIIAVVVSKDENNNITLDDSTAQISGRSFDKPEQIEKISVGQVVLVIGRPREFNNQIYLTIEIIKPTIPGWVAYRRKELSLVKKLRNIDDVKPVKIEKPKEAEIVENTSTLSSKDRIAKFIKELDRGEGAIIEDVLRMSKVNNGEELLSDMMMRGEIYESKAGYVKLM